MLKSFNKKKKDNKGFTLVELVIVIAILAILVGVLAPQYVKYVEKSRKAADASNVENVVTAIKVAGSDEEYSLPAGDYTVTLTTEGLKVTETGAAAKALTENNTDTTKNGALTKALVEYMGADSTTQYKDGEAIFSSVKRKSAKWGKGDGTDNPTATATVSSTGAVSVVYSPDDFAAYATK